MTGTIKGLIATFTLAAAAACSDASPTGASYLTAPEQAVAAKSGSGTLSFSYTQSQSTENPQSSSGGTGAINFAGSLTTGTPCVTVSASHRTQSTDVTVTVSAASSGDVCIQVITYNNYQGQISGLAPGTYNLTVVHQLGSSSSTAHSSTVVVQ